MSSEIFHLPGHNALLKSDIDDEVILVDASESPIEQSKKTGTVLLRKEKKTHNKKSGSDKRGESTHSLC